MTIKPSIRPMNSLDISSVLMIQAYCYDKAKQESATSFLSKLESPEPTSFVAELGNKVVGYLVSVPVDTCCPLPLNDTDYLRPSQAIALYLHDLAVHPDARNFGVAAALMHQYQRALSSMALRIGCLTSVNGSSQFWERYGFRDIPLDGPAFVRLITYGADARFMTLDASLPW